MWVISCSLGVFALLLMVNASIFDNFDDMFDSYGDDADACSPTPCMKGDTCKIADDGVYCQYKPMDMETSGSYSYGDDDSDCKTNLNRIYTILEKIWEKLDTPVVDCPEVDPMPMPTETPDPCASMPCRYGAECTSSVEEGTFTCDCPFPTGGDTCEEELGGCENCSRMGNMVLFLLNDKAMNFTDSVKTCEDQSLQLFTPSTNATFAFGQKFMQDQDKAHIVPVSGSYAYWVNGVRKTNDAPFYWADSDTTPITYFGNWLRSGPDSGDNNCMEMGNGAFDFMFDNDPCDEVSGSWTYFPACYGYYSFYDDED